VPFFGADGRLCGYRGIDRDITEWKQKEEYIANQRSLLDAINSVLMETLTCETDEEVARSCLATIEKLTDSKFGWIGEVNQAGRLDTIAISDPGWNACRIPRTKSVRLIKNMRIRGIRGKVLKEGRPLIANDPSSHPDWAGTPEGHPQVTSFLGVPLKEAGRTIGISPWAIKNQDMN